MRRESASCLLFLTLLAGGLTGGQTGASRSALGSEDVLDSQTRVGEIVAAIEAIQAVQISARIDEWCVLLHELAEIGDEAVPELCRVLDETESDRMVRTLGLVLRSIVDQRAVPALIRAIPRTLQPPGSDYGLQVNDAALAEFMQTHDLDRSEPRGNRFSYGRAVREIFGALHHLTGQDFEDDALFSIHLRQDPRSQELQQHLFHQQAAQWAEWWEAHWSEFTSDSDYSRVELPQFDPVEASDPSPGLRPATDSGISGIVISPASEDGPYNHYFLDLDTGATPRWPRHLKREEIGENLDEIGPWAARKGIDLVCVTYRPTDGEPTFALRALNMRVWEIDVESTGKMTDAAQPPNWAPTGDLLLHFNKETNRYEPDSNGAFLCQTREQGYVLIVVTDQVTRILRPDETGFDDWPKGAGFQKGVRFDIKTFRTDPGD